MLFLRISSHAYNNIASLILQSMSIVSQVQSTSTNQ